VRRVHRCSQVRYVHDSPHHALWSRGTAEPCGLKRECDGFEGAHDVATCTKGREQTASAVAAGLGQP
jgi:hypothetical protein